MEQTPQRPEPPRQRTRVRVDPASHERVELAGKRCALYLRVSTSEQTVDHQELQLRHWAASHGVQVVKVYSDENASGSKHRKMLDLLLRDAASPLKPFDLVAIWSLDRLTRQGIEVTLGYLRRLHEAGVRVISAQERWLDSDSPVWSLLVSVISWFAEFERKRNSERTKAAHLTAKTNGKRWGRKPKVTEADIQAIRGNLRRKEPKTLTQMGQQLNLSRATVYKVQIQHRWKSKTKPGRRRVTEETITQIRELLRNPENGVHAIRKKTGAGISTISKIRGPLPQGMIREP